MSDEHELRDLVIKSLQQWAAKDLDAVTKPPGAGRGFGYRARDARIRTPEQHRAGVAAALASGTSTSTSPTSTCRSWSMATPRSCGGSFTERFQNVGHPSEEVRVRMSNTAVKRDGQWRVIWGHRDAQDFDGEGRYVRRPVDGSGG